jgi:hypothetical protein
MRLRSPCDAGTQTEAEIPVRLREYQRSWWTYHPAWEYLFWDDAANEQLLAEYYPEFNGYFHDVEPSILRWDLVRLAYLHRFGGVYADMDCEALRPLDPLLQGSRIVVGREWNGIGRRLRGRDYIINALIASPAGHPLWLEIMQRMSACRRARHLLERHTVHAIRMSIAVFDEAIEARQKVHGDVDVLGHTAFYPSSPAERLEERRRRDAGEAGSYVIHHYDNAWFSPFAKSINAVRLLRQRWVG